MSKYLVIVESPTKAKTISKILGKNFEIASSMGHLIDLPSRTLAIDIDNGFLPRYRVISGKEKILKALKEKAKGKEIVYLATDPDREGEAIGWHIKNKLDKEAEKFFRVIFHEITEEAIKEAFQGPRSIDMNKVNAQQARRILDRIVGYFLSPLLWKKVVRGLSAGRVQSVALRFIVEREKEIEKFVPRTTYGIEATFKVNGQEFKAKLVRFKGQKLPFLEKKQAQEVVNSLRGKKFFVEEIEEKNMKRKPPPPFTTSLLQQEAFNTFKFSSQKTMLLAQKLYEGVEIGEEMVGVITYMRTDSFFVADRAKKEVKRYIKEIFGNNYLPDKDYKFKEKKGAQLAHEAIRPTGVFREPEPLKEYLSSDLAKLYQLIWSRFVASFMEKAEYKLTKVIISTEEADFLAEGKKIIFDGFQKVLSKEEDKPLPFLHYKQEVALEKLQITEHRTKPPPRFTDASLVKLLEDRGIGRPSTYAPTISTLIKRNYVKREKGTFVPTDLGIKVCELLTKFFPEIMDEKFTAQMEDKLDAVEEGRLEWKKILEDFYPSFKEKIDKAAELIKKTVVFTEEKCPQCSRLLVVKWSRRGKFLSCSGFPECRYAKSITTEVTCPSCKEGKLIERRNKRGQRFYGCTKYPQCTFTAKNLPKERKETNKNE